MSRDVRVVCDSTNASHLQVFGLALVRFPPSRAHLVALLPVSQDCALSAKERPEGSRMFTLGDVVSAVSATR